MMVKENNQFDQHELKRVAGAQRTACGVRDVQQSARGEQRAATDDKQQRATATEMRRTR